ncbi:TetR/AcrR family transcriptional regulator [Phaeobacter inhibens]|uniref:TetR/AcrR family transcriptional regulator n=1 Tax=Phaeobacter inhibens TaxID=221822 RepID=UPI0021A8EBF1|nr:TetR/AcrR family transcriptional regulator [Phaeobacter inhibens]UWR60867.1 TetR/AcrR family transcriptional regulator [Phaeobacter inhibens]
MNQPAAIPRKGRKYDQVLQGARDVFMAHGFEGASVDDIARKAGVSKATLYSYFPDKRLLFIEVARHGCARQADTAVTIASGCCDPETALREAGHHILSVILSEFGVKMFRICVAEADRFPDLGRRFYESGPATIRAQLREYLAEATSRGELRIDDLDLAADQFAELCRADMFLRLLFNIEAEIEPQERERVVDAAITTFLARYGALAASDETAR